MRTCLLAIAAAGLLAGCGSLPRHDPGVGQQPLFPAPEQQLIPNVNIAPETGWEAGATPVAPQGLAVQAFARGLRHPRWLYVLPNGDVLVAETNAPPKSGALGGIKGWVMGLLMDIAGAAVPSANRIVLLRDADGDGRAELKTDFMTGLYSPFGMALVGDTLYLANATELVRVPYVEGATRITATPERVVDLPGERGGLNHHWTKSLLASRDGRRLYVGVGSNSNVAEQGFAAERDRAAILEIDPVARTVREYATGLRNPVGLDWRPGSDELWAVVNERDMLGNNLPPDYLTHVLPGAFYGWPYSYWGQKLDPRVEQRRPDLVERARRPDYALGNHVAPLGLAFNTSPMLRPVFGEGAFVGLHGSWNREVLNGYEVVFVPFVDGRPTGLPRDVLGGFLTDDGKARGRPVGVVVAKDGALLVADDVGNAVWRVVTGTD